jgi:hypothetical protein
MPALADILHDAGVSFGPLFDGERSAGNDGRRAGEEGLFEAIFTTDPHLLKKTLRNEYPQYFVVSCPKDLTM